MKKRSSLGLWISHFMYTDSECRQKNLLLQWLTLDLNSDIFTLSLGATPFSRAATMRFTLRSTIFALALTVRIAGAATSF